VLQVPFGGLHEHFGLNGSADLTREDVDSVARCLVSQEVEYAMDWSLQRIADLAGDNHTGFASAAMSVRQANHALDIREAPGPAADVSREVRASR
jgi:hypothetical protein